MTRIDFYVDVDDRLGFACRLIAKALQQSVRVLVYAPAAETAERIDRMLWAVAADRVRAALHEP